MGASKACSPFHKRIISLSLIPLCLLFVECKSRRIKRELYQVESAKEINPDKQYVKVHMYNRDLYVLNAWAFDTANERITGKGTHLDFNRRLVEERKSGPDHFVIPTGDIVLLETNDKGNNPGIAVLVIASLVTGAFAIACLVNPKGCFGSCPTFFVDHESEQKLVGERFSSSISKSLAAMDVDLIHLPQN